VIVVLNKADKLKQVTLTLSHPLTLSPSHPLTLSPSHQDVEVSKYKHLFPPNSMLVMSSCKEPARMGDLKKVLERNLKENVGKKVPLILCPSHPLNLSPSHSLTLSPSHPLTLSPSHLSLQKTGDSNSPVMTRQRHRRLITQSGTSHTLTTLTYHPLTLSPLSPIILSHSHPLT